MTQTDDTAPEAMRDPATEQELIDWLAAVRNWTSSNLVDVRCETFSYGDSPEQVVDLWSPRDGASRGLVVSLHGGGFSAEYAREINEPLVRQLAAQGFVVANVEYRRVGSEGSLAATTADVDAAISAVAAREGGAPGELAVFGHSAGGFLALWAAEHPAVGLVLALSPVADLAGWHETGLDEGYTALWMGAGPEADPELYRQADLTPRLSPGTETVLLHGVLDEAVPHQYSVDLHRAADRAGTPVGLELLEAEGHYGWLDPRLAASIRVQNLLEDWRASRPR